jgi:molybdopterin-containing oxidoreductase family iron-sulfur binding subunit
MTRLKVLDSGAPRPAAPSAAGGLDLEALRRRLAAAEGPQFWRSLEEVAATPDFVAFLHREFPRQASEWLGGDTSRRRFLQLMGASLALGGMAACTTQPPEKIVPYVDMPEGVVPGRPLFFATTHSFNGYGRGVLVESHQGRPTKVEGNPGHPASLGATDAFAQASVLDLYDPQRLQVVRRLGLQSTWNSFTGELAAALNAQGGLRGAGLRLLTGAVTSPTMVGQIEELLASYPGARWHVWEPALATEARAGLARAHGADREAVYDLSRADVVLTLDSDFLVASPGAPRYARELTARRRTWAGAEKMAGAAAAPGTAGGAGRPMLRLYAVESTPTATATLADHRLTLPPSEVVAFARAVAAELGVPGGRRRRLSKPQAAKWAVEVAKDLRAHGGAALVVPGEYAPAELHALAHALNRALGAVGRTVRYGEPVVAGPPDHLASLRELVADLRAGAVDVLLVAAQNPVFTAPPDLELGPALLLAPFSAYLTAETDETAEHCRWLLPQAHYLEAWSDARAFDGTASLVQPLIQPLYPGARSLHEVLAAFAGRTDASGYELVRQHWQRAGLGGAADYEAAWRRALHDGVVAEPTAGETGGPDPAAAAAGVAPGGAPAPTPGPGSAGSGEVAGATAASPAASPLAGTASTGAEVGEVAEVDELEEEDILGEVRAADGARRPDEIELNFRPDPTIWDGRWANNAWLQELPKPITKLTWDNALLVGTATAERFGLESTDLVDVEWRGRRLTVPVWVVPAHADHCATLHLGYGRRRVGPVGAGTGFDAFALRTSDALWTAPAVRLRKAGGRYPLACTQDHHSMEGRHLVRHGTVERFAKEPHFVHEMVHRPAEEMTFYPGFDDRGHAWGMVIDLNACTGCNACVVACQSENSIPTVGKQQVLNAREMHWIRIDRYYEGSLDEPRLHHQPLPCMHCENAPCEVVCPVAATVHSDEGLNDMVYNRCVGTRYCSNNCPYKVRRFNFFKWADTETELLKMARNPDVTVRGRGVMEKCTYCVQRINLARIDAKRAGRRVADGEVVTACQQACPSDAIVFGDLNDAGARVSRWREQLLDYGLLEEINTRPRTTYLAKLSNPNPALET